MDSRLRVWAACAALPLVLLAAACGGGELPTDGGTPPSDTRPPTDTRPPLDVTAPPDATCSGGQTNCAGACANLQSDDANCGACGTRCATGQRCNGGRCETACASGMTACGTTCANLQTDNANCGACGTACPAGQACVMGACACPAGQMRCGGACVDTQTDNANCGACGTTCPAGQTCVAGACACPMGQTRCGGACVNTATDPTNCGACDTPCPMGQMCVTGMCQIDCPAPNTRCTTAGGMMTCVNTADDPMNCGACGTACAAGRVCAAGACACPAGQTECGGACVDTRTNAMNCGACGNVCPAGTACAAGACVCPAGQTLCGGICRSTSTDPSNCGACGVVCSGGRMCSGGACACPAGQTLCSGICRSTSTDPSNCGACGNACSGGATCVGGTCTPPRPANDDRLAATTIALGAAEAVVTGTTTGATRDGPTVACGCTSAGNVWYRFTLAESAVVYFDTAGSGYDTSLFITDSAGTPVAAQSGNGQPNAGLCNDDAGCGTAGGFTSSLQSRTWGTFAAGTYYVSVSGCSTGSFTLRAQRILYSIGSYFYSGRFSGDSSTSTVLVGTSRQTSLCGGSASGEDVRWFVTCGAQQFFSLCASDGGTFVRRNASGTVFDPSMYIRSGQSGAEVVCNDDGGSMGGTNCVGTGGDTAAYGSRLNNVTVPRGINALFVDERVGGSGMTYTLRYTVR